MKQLLKKIDDYLDIQEKKEAILLSSNGDIDLDDMVEIIKNSDDINEELSLLDDDMRKKIEKLIEGGIL